MTLLIERKGQRDPFTLKKIAAWGRGIPPGTVACSVRACVCEGINISICVIVVQKVNLPKYSSAEGKLYYQKPLQCL